MSIAFATEQSTTDSCNNAKAASQSLIMAAFLESTLSVDEFWKPKTHIEIKYYFLK